MRLLLLTMGMSAAISAPVLAQANISASLLPTARSVDVGAPATAFAAIVNGGDAEAVNCRLELRNGGPGAIDAGFSYQTTTPENALTGTPNTPVNIAAGATQNFLISLTPNTSFSAQEAIIDFVCDGEVRADYRPGLTTLLLSAGSNTPDIIAIGATLSSDGVSRVPAAPGFNPFSVSAINIGAGDPAPDANAPFAGSNEATITVRPEFSGLDLPLTLDICETNSLGVCTSARGSSVTAQIGDEASFFTVRAIRQGAGVPFYPDIARIEVVFEDAGGVERGRTSVAVVAEGPAVTVDTASLPVGIWNLDVSGAATGYGEIIEGTLVVMPQGEVYALANLETFGQFGAEYAFQGLFEGDAQATPQPTFAGLIAHEFFDNANLGSADASGRWSPRTEVRGNFQSFAATDIAGPQFSTANGPRRIRAVYDLTTDRVVTLAGLAGTYDLMSIDDGTPNDIGDITVEATGFFSGLVSDEQANICNATGSFSHPDVTVNLFSMVMGLTGSCQFASNYFGAASRQVEEELQNADAIVMLFGNSQTTTAVFLVPKAQN